MANTIDAETLLNAKRAMHDQLMDAFLDLREFCTEKPPPETGSLLGPAEPAPELTQEQQEAMAEKRTMIVSIVRRLRNIEWMFGLVGQMRRQAARLQVSSKGVAISLGSVLSGRSQSYPYSGRLTLARGYQRGISGCDNTDNMNMGSSIG